MLYKPVKKQSEWRRVGSILEGGHRCHEEGGGLHKFVGG